MSGSSSMISARAPLTANNTRIAVRAASPASSAAIPARVAGPLVVGTSQGTQDARASGESSTGGVPFTSDPGVLGGAIYGVPKVYVIGGAVGVLGLAGLIWWKLRS